jgi:hypothetical protein
MSLCVITSRAVWRPWPKLRWVARREYRTARRSDGTEVTFWFYIEDYELVWPWMKCQAVGIHKGG